MLCEEEVATFNPLQRHTCDASGDQNQTDLEKKAKIYLDNCMKDQKRLQQLRVPGTMSEHAPVSLGPPSFLDSPVDFEFEADPKKYIDEVQKSLSKNQEISDNFQRFIQMMFEDTE